MSTLLQLREEVQRLSILGQEAQNAEDYPKALGYLREAAKVAANVKEIEEQQAELKRLTGDLNRPTNAIPLTGEELATYDPKDTGAKYNSSYRPAGWVKTMDGRHLSAAIQPKWVRDQMGQNLKDEARFYGDTWAKWFRARKENAFWSMASAAEAKAMQENTDAEGGFFVPEEYRTIVLHDPGVPGSVHRPFCSTLTTSLKDGYFPTFGSVTWAAIAEEGAFGDNTPTVGQVSFSVSKSGGTVKVSAELLEDAATNLAALLSQVFNEARGRYEDTKIIAGSGANEPEGLRTALGASQTFTFANATSVIAADIIKAYWALPAQYRNGAIWSMTSSLMAQIESIGATAAGIHFAGGGEPDGTAAAIDRLRGKPYVTFDGTGWDDAAAIASAEVVGVIGDFKNYYLIDRIGMTMRRDDSVYAANDQVGFFCRARFDGRVGVVNAFRLLKAA